MDRPGVTSKLFSHRSDLHGAAHVNRVIVLAEILCAALPSPSEVIARRVWAAAFLHDLARRHDEACLDHGRWAVEEKWNECLPLFVEQGLTEDDFPHVKTAVEWHSYSRELADDHPHWLTTALLKDADALDRVRLRPDEQTDPDYLRLDHTERFMPLAQALYDRAERLGWKDIYSIQLLAQGLLRKRAGKS